MSQAHALQSGTNDSSRPSGDEQDPERSARFRIKIDALGRIVPEVVPVEEDATEADAEPVALRSAP